MYEEERLINSTTSPDGSLRLEEYCYEGERLADYHRLKLVSAAGGGDLWVELGQSFRVDKVEFGPGESLGVVLRFEGTDIPVRIDTRAKTFSLHPHEQPEPLDRLPKRIRERFSKPVPPQRPTLRRFLVMLLELGGALLMLAASGFATWLEAGSGKKPWAGGLGVLLFGAATVFCLRDLLAAISGLRQSRQPGAPFFRR